MDEDKLARAGDLLQSAILGSLPWAGALDSLAEVAGARGAAVIPVSPDFLDCPFSRNIQELGHVYTTTHWARDDFRKTGLGKMLRTGIAVDQDIVAPETMERMAYYAEFLGPRGVWWFAGVPFRAGEQIFCLTVQRTRAEGPVVEAEQEALRRLGCGLSQSATVAARVAAARIGGLLDGLEAMDHPAVLLDGEGRVLQANAAAAAHETDLRMRVGHPLAALSSANRQLQVHLRAAVGRDARPDDPALRPVALRRDGRRPLVLRARRLTGESASLFSVARAIVLIDDLDRAGSPPAALLRDLFGLTPAQARVAALVGGGASLRECADELHIATETVRTYLKQAFQGVGVSRQAELVSVLSRLHAAEASQRR